MKTILILGASVMQLPAIRIAERKGWKVAVADGNPLAVGREAAHSFHVIDLKDRDRLLALAGSLKAKDGLNGIFTAGTDFSSTVAWLCERTGLPGIPYATAMKATDKVLMRQAFQASHVPSPAFALWTGEGDPAIKARGVGFPLVVKPVDNMGSRGVKRVDTENGLPAACQAALRASRSSRVIIEQYMEGPELSLDAVVYRGEVTICGVADRHIYFPPYFVEMGHTMPTALGAKARRGMEEVFRAGISAIGIDHGAAKGDIKLTPGGPMVGEIAARLSGGYMSGWTFPFSSGVEVTEAALNIAVGLPPGDLTRRQSMVSAERALISIPGTVREVAGENGARRVAGIREVFLRTGPGRGVVFPTNNVEKCGNVISCRRTRPAAIRAAEQALARISILLEPRNDATDRFLFPSGGLPDGLDAFALLGAENKAALVSLPPFRGEPAAIPGGPGVGVLALPRLSGEQGRDWHGMGLPEALSRLVEDGTIVLVQRPEEGAFVLGGLFWRAFLRGGAQGARYFIESLQAAARCGEAEIYLEKACGH